MGALTRNQEHALGDVQRDFAADMTKFAAVLPSHVKPERFLRVVVTALTMKPELLNAPRDIILNECLRCASDGLIPDGREAALVPRYGREFSLAYQPMIAGIKKKVRNSGEVVTWDVVAVRENDDFDFAYGLNPKLDHTYDIRKPRGEMIAVYSVATLKNGTKTFDIMSKDDVNRIRDRSDAYKAFKANKIKSTPWDSDYEEMAKKTVARRHSKDLPSSTDLDRLLYQGEFDRPVDFGDVTATARAAGSRPKTIEGRLDAIAGETVDSETGEVTEDGDAGGEGVAPMDEARREGAQAFKDGKKKRQMPAKYRNDDALSEAWVEGFDAAEEDDGRR